MNPAAPSAARLAPGTPPPAAPLGWYWGDDAWSINRAVKELARRLAGPGEPPLTIWRTTGATITPAGIEERVATATLFGGGTLVVVAEPEPLLRSKAGRDRLTEILGAVAPGNGLAFAELVNTAEKKPSTTVTAFREVVKARGGEVRQHAAPKEGEMAHWIEERARELDVRLARGAAQTLAERVGAFVREGDIDRRRQGELAVAELEKLGIYRVGREVSAEDVKALVAEAVPASSWAFLDAIGSRRSREAARLLDAILAATPAPLLVVQLHRRIREILEVAELVAAGETPQAMARTLKLHEFRLKKLLEQARLWRPQELETALEGLLELDAAGKGVDGRTESSFRLGMTLWVATSIASGGAPAGSDQRVGRA